MATISRTVATLRIMGDDLDPNNITDILGHNPSRKQKKGEILIGKNTGRKREAKFGMWSLSASAQEPGNLDTQIPEILGKLNQDITAWNDLARKYDLDLFCGLFMLTEMEGLCIDPKSLLLLGQRNIELALDIYGPDEPDD